MGKWRYSSTFLDLGIIWRRVVSFMPLTLYPWERFPVTLWIGGRMDPIVCLDALEKRKILHCRESSLIRSACRQLLFY
jgi:hypothetical protein